LLFAQFLIIAKNRTLPAIASHSKYFFLVLIVMSLTILKQENCLAQRDSVRTKKRFLAFGVPVVFYTPETRFGFGASGISLFNFKSDSLNAPRSSVSIGFAYTQNRQILSFLPFNLFIRNRAWQVYGELAYNKYFYNFYGTGNRVPDNHVEKYGVEFPRLRLTVLKRIFPHFYFGPRIVFDRYTLFDLDTNGLIYNKQVSGSDGGVIAGPGVVIIHDSRDNIFYPTRGVWGEFVVYRNDRRAGGTFNYTRLALDVSKYFSMRKNILAVNLYSIFADTDVPFFQMGMMGGLKKMRGFYEGRYRDNNLLVLQAEYRRQLFPFLGFTVFADAGQVAARYERMNSINWRYTYGAGIRLRLDKVQKINLRIDAAVGNNKILPYFTIGEAF
jgi:hypothetical protein